MKGWRTYTPDGRMLEVEQAHGQWIARCGGRRAAASSALEAITGALGAGPASIGPGDSTLESWVTEHAAQLEAEAG